MVLVARTQGGLEEVDDAIRKVGGTASLTPLDLTEFEGIDKLGAALYERYKKLDILIGNAGLLGTLGPMGHTDPQIWDQTGRKRHGELALNSQHGSPAPPIRCRPGDLFDIHRRSTATRLLGHLCG